MQRGYKFVATLGYRAKSYLKTSIYTNDKLPLTPKECYKQGAEQMLSQGLLPAERASGSNYIT